MLENGQIKEVILTFYSGGFSILLVVSDFAL